jgi:hypothetical protein
VREREIKRERERESGREKSVVCVRERVTDKERARERWL